MHHLGGTAESLDGLALVAVGDGRFMEAARLLARAQLLRAESQMQRSSVSTGFVATVEAELGEALSADALRRAREEAAHLDLRQLA